MDFFEKFFRGGTHAEKLSFCSDFKSFLKFLDFKYSSQFLAQIKGFGELLLKFFPGGSLASFYPKIGMGIWNLGT